MFNHTDVSPYFHLCNAKSKCCQQLPWLPRFVGISADSACYSRQAMWFQHTNTLLCSSQLQSLTLASLAIASLELTCCSSNGRDMVHQPEQHLSTGGRDTKMSHEAVLTESWLRGQAALSPLLKDIKMYLFVWEMLAINSSRHIIPFNNLIELFTTQDKKWPGVSFSRKYFGVATSFWDSTSSESVF